MAAARTLERRLLAERTALPAAGRALPPILRPKASAAGNPSSSSASSAYSASLSFLYERLAYSRLLLRRCSWLPGDSAFTGISFGFAAAGPSGSQLSVGSGTLRACRRARSAPPVGGAS